MDSDIRIESHPGKGSRFWFEIAVPVEAELAAIPAVQTITGYEGPRKKVLIVDDVTENRNMLIDLLQALGFETTDAVNGEQALQEARAAAPALIIMDMVMPVMDGLEAMRRIRQIPGIQAIPIIAVSASATEEDQTQYLAAGANVFLPKPIEQAHLLQQIGELLHLTWEVEQPEAQEASEGPLVVPPRAELEALHALALVGNMREIRAWVVRMQALDQRYGPFTDKLRDLALGYQSKAILGLVEEQLGRLVEEQLGRTDSLDRKATP
jgi:CheY-like chemotaxis protein